MAAVIASTPSGISIARSDASTSHSSPKCAHIHERIASVFQLFEPLGGIADGNEVAELLRKSRAQPLSVLARWIVNREVVHFTWQGGLFLPRFQFDPERLGVGTPVPPTGLSRVLTEFQECFEDWEIAEWLATPNNWLGSIAPAHLVVSRADLVVEAARADRYIAKGW